MTVVGLISDTKMMAKMLRCLDDVTKKGKQARREERLEAEINRDERCEAFCLLSSVYGSFTLSRRKCRASGKRIETLEQQANKASGEETKAYVGGGEWWWEMKGKQEAACNWRRRQQQIRRSESTGWCAVCSRQTATTRDEPS